MSTGFVESRKQRAQNDNMKIVSFNGTDDSYEMSVIGTRKKTYTLKFEKDNISCDCPDHTYKKGICKHIFFVLDLSKNTELFNLNTLEDLGEKLPDLFKSMTEVINSKDKTPQQTVTINRDDHCSICHTEFISSDHIEKCKTCEHVIHYDCLNSWWNMSLIQNQRGKCPYCRSNNGFSHIEKKREDPWVLFQKLEIKND